MLKNLDKLSDVDHRLQILIEGYIAVLNYLNILRFVEVQTFGSCFHKPFRISIWQS